MTLDRYRIRLQSYAMALIVLPLLMFAGFETIIIRYYQVPMTPDEERLHWIVHFGCVAVIAFIAGMMTAALHPLQSRTYLNWLTTTPWQHSMKLPLGQPWPIAQDLPFLLILELISTLVAGARPGLALATFACGYVVASLIVLAAASEFATLFLIGMLLPAMPWARQSPWAMAIVGSLILAITWASMVRSLRNYPWHTQEPKRPNIELGWPLSSVGPTSAPHGVTPIRALAASILAAWWFYSATRLIPNFDPLSGFGALICVTFVAALIRWAIYVGGHLPPISFFGRIWTGRWIIPRYDQIVVAPTLSFVLACAGPIVLRWLHVDAALALALSGFAAMLVLLQLGPSRRRFDLTGAFRASHIRRLRARPDNA